MICIWGTNQDTQSLIDASLHNGCICEHYIHQYRKTSDIRRTFVGNNIVDHSDVMGASPVGAAPTTSSFST